MAQEPQSGGAMGGAAAAAVAAAMWSVYYHSTDLPSLKPSIFDRVRPLDGRQPPDWGPSPLQLQPLAEAIGVLLSGQGAYARLRRLQALRKLGAAGLANAARLKALIEKADSEHAAKVARVGEAIDKLLEQVVEDWKTERFRTLRLIRPAHVSAYIDELLLGLNTCAPVGTTCSALYEPNGAGDDNPITTVRATAYVKRNLADLARVLDPRAWECCAPEVFTKSQRVSCSYGYCTDVPHVPGDLGTPWTGQLEEVVVFGGYATLQNWLNIDFTVSTISFGAWNFWKVLVNYSLFRSGRFTIPAFFIVNEVENVVVDEGYLQAVKSLNPNYPASDGWAYVEVVKKVRFVDLTDYSGSNPWGIDPGEVLNYWAPVLLCLWLESGTQGFLCCDPATCGSS
jgi:hypothetical protein